MAIQFDVLKKTNEKLKQGGEGGNLFLRQKDIGDATPFRLSPNTPAMAGMPYLRVVQWWFNGEKSVISLETFGKACPIQEEIDAAMESDDADVVALASDENRIKKQESYWFPGWQLKYKLDGNEVVGIGVVDKGPKILQTSSMLCTAMNEIILSRMVQKIKAEDTIADRELGYNLMLTRTKTGSGKRDVKYTCALDEQWEVPVKYFQDALDPEEVAKSFTPTKAYQRALIREMLYGEEIPQTVEAKEKERQAANKEAFKVKMAEKEAAAAKPAAKPQRASIKDADADDEDEDDDKPVAKKSAPAKKAITNKLPFDADEDEEDKPSTKAVAKKKTPVDEADMSDDDEDDTPVKKPAPTSKKMAKDLDFEDDD